MRHRSQKPKANKTARPRRCETAAARTRKDGQPDRRAGNGGVPPTPEADRSWWQIFCAAYLVTGTIGFAARAAGVSRDTFERHRRGYPEFREMFEDAREDFIDLLEEEVVRRALKGSDRLLADQLRARRPSVYGAPPQNNFNFEITPEMMRALPPDALERVAAGTQTGEDMRLLTRSR